MSYTEPIECRHCLNIAPMEITANASEKVGKFGDADYGSPVDEYTCYEICKCPACRKVTIRSYYWNDVLDPQDVMQYDVLYPSESEIPLGLPSSIKREYLDCEKAKRINPNLYAMSIRRLLENICHEHNSNGKNLFQMLKDLASRGIIPENLAIVAQGIREFGNVGAHGGTKDLSMAEVGLINSLSNAVLEFLYTAPYLASLAEEKLETLKINKKKSTEKQSST